MSLIRFKKKYQSLCSAKKYNNFSSIDCKAKLNADNIFLEGNLFYSLCSDSYDNQLYNCTFQNHILHFNKGYYLLKKQIQFTNQFDIFLQFDLNDYNAKSIIFMNDDQNGGFRLSFNKYKHENKILFQLYETNGIKQVECEYSNLFTGFNKLEIKLKDKKLKMFLNDDLMSQNTIIGDIINSEQYLCIGAYYKEDRFCKTLKGNLKNIKILNKCI